MRVGVVLSGCGVYDGTEIHEAALTLYFLDRSGAKIICMAPDAAQMHVIDHGKGSPTDEKRNVLVESARIARGEIKDLSAVSAADLDALIFPGGFGAAKNLCDFAVKGADCSVHPRSRTGSFRQMHESKKPLGFLCIAPVLAARVLGPHHPSPDDRKRRRYGGGHRGDGRETY